MHVTAAVEYFSVMSRVSFANAAVWLIKVKVFNIVVNFDSLKASGAA